MASLYGTQKDEFVCSLAALILHDGEAEITADNIKTLVNASGNTVAPYWPALFAPFLRSNIEAIISSGGAGGAAAPAAAAAAAAPAGGAPAAAEKPKEKPKIEEVDALDGGMSMFGGSGGAKDY